MDIDILKKEPSKLYVAPGPTGEITAIDLDQGNDGMLQYLICDTYISTDQ